MLSLAGLDQEHHKAFIGDHVIVLDNCDQVLHGFDRLLQGKEDLRTEENRVLIFLILHHHQSFLVFFVLEIEARIDDSHGWMVI